MNSSDAEFCFSCGLPQEDARSKVEAIPSIGATSQFQAAGFWIRLLAYIADSVVTAVLYLLAAAVYGVYLAATSGIGAMDSMEDSFFDIAGILITSVYTTFAVGVYATTVGKRLFGLYVYRTDGSKVGIGRALLRLFATGFSALILGIGFLMIASRDDKRALHDLICDTKVVRRRGPAS